MERYNFNLRFFAIQKKNMRINGTMIQSVSTIFNCRSAARPFSKYLIIQPVGEASFNRGIFSKFQVQSGFLCKEAFQKIIFQR